MRRNLLLTPAEVERILRGLGFVHQRTTGDHAQWEGIVKGSRRVSTVQLIRGPYAIPRVKRLIENVGLTPEEFYGVDERIAKRYAGR